MAINLRTAQIQKVFLAGAGVAIGDATMTLQSFKSIDGVPLVMTDFGNIGYGTVEPASRDREEQISFTGIVQNVNGTATLTGIKSVLFLFPWTETPNFAKSHVGGSVFMISNTSGYEQTFANKFNDGTIVAPWTFNALANGANPKIDNIAYVPAADDYIVRDYANGSFLRIDGTNQMLADLNFGGFKGINAANPTNPQDVATKAYVDANSGGGGGGASGKPMSFKVLGNSNLSLITGYQDRETNLYAFSNSDFIALLDSIGFIQSRDVTIDSGGAGNVVSAVLIDNNLYVLFQNGALVLEVWQYDASDLSLGGTLVTFVGQALTPSAASTRMTSNGTDIFFTFDSGNSVTANDIAKFSIAATTFTYVSTTTVGVTATQFDATFAVDDSENYYGIATNVFFQYDSTGALQYTSDNINTSTETFLNWTNTIYNGDVNEVQFTKLYLPDTEINSGSSGTTIRVTAAEDLTIGQPVGASNLLNNSVSKAGIQGYSDTVGFAVILDGERTIQIATDKVAVVYQETATSNLNVNVSSVDRTDFQNAFAFGATGLVTNDIFSFSADLFPYDICQLDTDKFAVIYVEAADDTKLRYRIATVVGTVITYGVAADLVTAPDSIRNVSCTFISTDKAIVSYAVNNAGTFESYTIAFTAAGTIATPGAAVQIISGGDELGCRIVGKVATDKFAVLIENISSGGGDCVVGTLAGTVITLGAVVQITVNYNRDASVDDMTSPADNVVVFSYEPNVLIAGTIVGTVPTFGASVALLGGNPTGIIATSATEILIFGGAQEFISKSTLAGNVLSASQIVANEIDQTFISNRRPFINMGTYFLIIGFSGTSLNYFIQGMANGFIGIVQSNVSMGGIVSVLINGVDSHQTGLQPGAYYLISSAGLTFIANNITINSINDIQYVKAISPTSIVI